MKNTIPPHFIEVSPGHWTHPSNIQGRPPPQSKGIGTYELAKEHHQKRIRQSTKPLLNKLENEFFEVLKCRRAETVDRITCQSLRFKLANGLWYKPDFAVWGYDSMWCYEVKGEHAFRGGFENLKMAAHQYPFIIWQLVWKDEGSWQFQTVLP